MPLVPFLFCFGWCRILAMKKFRFQFDAIDFLRIVAMLLVLIQHFVGMLDIESFKAIEPVFILNGAPAWSGITIFFFISAYLNIIGFIKGKYPFTVKGILTFYKQRALKIAIPYYILVATTIIIFYPTIFVDDLPTFFKLIFFVYNGQGAPRLGHTWFVSTIMQFYLVCPLLAFGIYKIKDKVFLAKILFFSIMFTGFILKVFLLQSGVDWYKHIYTSIYGNIDIFACGSLFFVINSEKRPESKLWLKITSIVLFLLVIVSNSLYVKTDEMGVRMFFPFIVMLSTAFMLYCFPKPVKKPYYYPSKLVTTTSYYIYLIHPFIGNAIIPHFQNIGVFAFIGVIVLLFVICFSISGAWLNLKWLFFFASKKIKEAKAHE